MNNDTVLGSAFLFSNSPLARDQLSRVSMCTRWKSPMVAVYHRTSLLEYAPIDSFVTSLDNLAVNGDLHPRLSISARRLLAVRINASSSCSENTPTRSVFSNCPKPRKENTANVWSLAVDISCFVSAPALLREAALMLAESTLSYPDFLFF